jgi:hypothetical protein
MLTKKESIKKEEKPVKELKTSASSSSTPLAKASAQSLVKTPSSSLVAQANSAKNSHPTTTKKTKITVKYDSGFSNYLTIRGEGAHLTWEKGQLLKNIKNDEWVWETEATFQKCQFKVLINDRQYELGPNRELQAGLTLQYTPSF